MLPRLVALGFALVSGVACASIPPPRSLPPDGASVIARLREAGACETSLKAKAKIDQFNTRGRAKGDLYLYAGIPSRLRLDAISPFGVDLATLTSDGTNFALADLRAGHFYVGPASACNIGRLTGVPLPAHVLVDLLRGQAPVLKHEGAGALAWNTRGYYVVTITGAHDAVERIGLAPLPEDMDKPWDAQRVRLVDVTVWQRGQLLYHAELEGHWRAPMSGPRVDPMGVDPPVAPSGPECEAEAPRRIHVEVPTQGEDVVFRYDELEWNPPILPDTFTQAPRPELPTARVACDD
jgi:hypothetical protein